MAVLNRGSLVAIVVVAGTLAGPGPGTAQAQPCPAGIRQAPVFPSLIERAAVDGLGRWISPFVRRIPLRDLEETADGYVITPAAARTLPAITVPVVAPAPLSVAVELVIPPGAPCTQIAASDGEVTVQSTIAATLVVGLHGTSVRVPFVVSKASMTWDSQRPPWLILDQLMYYNVAAPRAEGTGKHTWDSLSLMPEIRPWQLLLVDALAVPAARADAIALLARLGHEDLSSEAWARLAAARALLQPPELARLGWLAHRPVERAGPAAVFVSDPSSDPVPPRVFVGGIERTGWRAVGGKLRELAVPVAGLAAVRVEHRGGRGQTFIAALGPGVRIVLREVWGPTILAEPPGSRCGWVETTRHSSCAGDQSAPVRQLFDLRAICGGRPASEGSAIQYGERLVPSLPGRYARSGTSLTLEQRPDACRP